MTDNRPVQETITLDQANVDRLLTNAGWVARGNGFSYGRGLDAMTVSYTDGLFRWAWMNSTRVFVFNDLLRPKD